MGIASRFLDMAEAAMFTDAEVADVERVNDHFVRVDLVAPAFRDVRWTPGAKLQLRLPGGGRGLRTYTPVSWAGAEGRTRLLAYLHGEGPASSWFRRVGAGDRIRVFGPRRSLDAPAAGESIVFVGDESSLALACAFRTTGADLTCLFEAAEPDLLAGVEPGLGAQVCGSGDPAGLLDRLRALAAGRPAPYRLVVTGNAATVHAVRREVRTWAVPPAKVTGKAYWAVGRTGLD